MDGTNGTESKDVLDIFHNIKLLAIFSTLNIISVGCLMFSAFIIYFVGSHKSLPGKCLINLTIALGLAKLAFQINPNFSNTPNVCSSAAAAQHYVCLVAFLWLSILSHDLLKRVQLHAEQHLTNDIKEHTIDQEKIIRFNLCIAFAWGLPICIVLSCVVVEVFVKSPFHYGNPTYCGVFGDNMLILSLALPLVCFSVYAMIGFARVSVIIANKFQRKNNFQMLSPKYHLSNKLITNGNDTVARWQLGFYSKVTMVMLLSWLSGFIASFTNNLPGWILFVVMNSSQGLFVGFSLIISTHYWKDLLSFIPTLNKCCHRNSNDLTEVAIIMKSMDA